MKVARSERITIRLLPVEAALLRAAAREAEVSVGEFVRESALIEASK